MIKVENVVKAEIVSEEATTEDLHKAKKYKWWSNER